MSRTLNCAARDRSDMIVLSHDLIVLTISLPTITLIFLIFAFSQKADSLAKVPGQIILSFYYFKVEICIFKARYVLNSR